MKILKRITTIVALSLLLSAGAAQAGVITYTSSAVFLLAAGPGVVTEDYEGLVLNSIIANGAIVNGITYNLFPAGKDGRIDNLYNRLGNQSLAATSATLAAGYFFQGESVTVTFPYAVNAVGIYFNVYASQVNSLQVQTAVGSAGNDTAEITTLYFVGLISDVAFNSATFVGLANAGITSGYNLDNLSYAAAVPEPASLLLLGTGLAGLVAARRRGR